MKYVRSTTTVDLKTVFEPYPTRQDAKSKKFSKNKTKSKFRIEVIMENESCLTTLVDPTTVFEPDPKSSQSGPQKVKTTPQLSQRKSELNGRNASYKYNHKQK